MQTAPPMVDLAVTAQPAQSESVNVVTRLGQSCQAKLEISRGLPIRYFPIFLNGRMPEAFGALILRAASFKAYAMSGRSVAM